MEKGRSRALRIVPNALCLRLTQRSGKLIGGKQREKRRGGQQTKRGELGGVVAEKGGARKKAERVGVSNCN